MSARLGVLLLSLLLCVQAAAGATVLQDLARGDEAYARRAEGHTGLWAAPGPISEAIEAYEKALLADPDNQLARTKLLRALFFKGDYVVRDRDTKLRIFERGQAVGEDGITRLIAGTKLDRAGGKHHDELIEHLRNEPHAAGVYYWSAIHWGLWGRHRGKIAAARQGVASKVRNYARIVNSVDSTYESGGGHRMLGRLHAEAPKIPFVTGWVSRALAISELEAARSFSDDPLTLLYYIEALFEYDTSRHDEAIDLLRSLVTREPEPGAVVEHMRAVSDARVLLDRLSK
ncbi:MAG: hypothetical protein GY769_10780 [bacterium]|nr:hypothetical protein [bacterium]